MLACAVVAFTSVFAVDVGGQTLFARPDTTPDFASYRSLEECEVAALRVTDELETRKDLVWYDTMNVAMQRNDWSRRATSRRPDTAINVASVCLHRFNADTVHIKGLLYAEYISQVLLIAHRDQDMQRFSQHVLDSVRKQSKWKIRDALGIMMRLYGDARPVRLDAAKRSYAELLAALKDDSLKYTVGVAYTMSRIADLAGDTALFKEAAWHAIRTLDAIPAKERVKQLGKLFVGASMADLLRRLTINEALDSIAISTTAYKLWEANTIQVRIFGDEERKMPKDIDLSKVPDLVGEHYYVASPTLPNATSQRLAAYTTRGTVPRGEIPVRGHINLIYGLPSYCHAEGSERWIEEPKRRTRSAWQCAPVYAMLRRLKQRLPELEITILSSTYGTVGRLGPLKPAEEADTLAKFWLGWHQIPARLVVEERPFFMVPEPDGRRVDLPTPYSDTLHREITFPLKFFTDQDGVQITLPISAYVGQDESEENIRFLEALIRRGRK